MAGQKKYVDFYDYKEEVAEGLLKSKSTDDQIDGLLYTVLGSGDFRKSDLLIYRLIDSESPDLKRNAILCISHLVRIHKKIELEKYIPAIESILLSQDDDLTDQTEYALSNIWLSGDKEKISQLPKDTCVSRYFQVLRISDKFEKEENYIKGIEELTELKKAESNPSVQRIQATCIEYLNHFIK